MQKPDIPPLFQTIAKAESPLSFLETKRPPGPIRVIPGTALGVRTTCNANPAGSHHQECTAFEFVSMFLKHGIEVFNFGLQSSSRKPKENDTNMGKCLVKDQLAEIPVSDDQHT